MWIEEFREQHGLDLEEFARRVRILGARKRKSRPIDCSDNLIYILERHKGAVTHPNIANVIAEACGATARQRDMIVAARHRGTWAGNGRAMALLVDVRVGMPAKPKNTATGIKLTGPKIPNGKDIVKIDRNGKILAKYSSLGQAALNNNQSMSMVEQRVNRKTKNEFGMFGFSYRRAEEWENLSDYERRIDIEKVKVYAGRG